MPFTPFHLGPALLFGLALSAIFDLSTLLVASVMPDLEPFYVMYFRVSDYRLHGFFHSYLGSSIMAVLVAFIIYQLRDPSNRIMVAFRVSQKSSFKNPFINLLSTNGSYRVIYGFCSITALLGVILYFYKIRKGVAVLG